jgi:TetR/AcrR family transcriptional regulator
MPRSRTTTPPSQDSLLNAATQVFMEAGFSGARVDEIARRAKANKAMIYYHFGSKRGLYRAVLTRLFSPAVGEIERLSAEQRDPLERLRLLYTVMARQFAEQPALPHIMMREVLSGGRGMDREAARAIVVIVASVRSALEQGTASGAFRPLDPLLVHIGMLGPLVMYFASQHFRERLLPMSDVGLRQPTPEAMVAHLCDLLERGLSPDPPRAIATASSREKEPS